MKVRIFTINPKGNEETLCKTFRDEADLNIELDILRCNGYQIQATLRL